MLPDIACENTLSYILMVITNSVKSIATPEDDIKTSFVNSTSPAYFISLIRLLFPS